MEEKIGILAGSGQFPQLVAKAAKEQGAKVFICGLIGHTDPEMENFADDFVMLPLGQLSKQIDFFQDNDVSKICLAGAVKKPKVADVKPDFRATKLLFRIAGQGDNAILEAVAHEYNSEGVQVVQAADLVPGLRAPEGVLTKRKPSNDDWDSIKHGWPIGKGIGAFDIGQCLVLRKKMVVTVEGVEGTDVTLERGGIYGGEGCVALKTLKPKQDTRVDLPAMGKNTIEIMAKYKYSCLAYEAGMTLFFDREESIALANKHNIAIIGLTAADFK